MQHQENSHADPTMDTDYRPTRYGSTDTDRLKMTKQIHHVKDQAHHTHKHKAAYRSLVWMGIVHVPIMYLIMFSMVDTAGDIFQNLNTFYMALMMAAPMVAIMPFMMKDMYPDKKKNALVAVASLVILFGAFAGIRYQTAIADTQFIRSMIPHHSGAILMCREANITDPELKTLCQEISKGQREEIVQMNQILDRLKK